MTVLSFRYDQALAFASCLRWSPSGMGSRAMWGHVYRRLARSFVECIVSDVVPVADVAVDD